VDETRQEIESREEAFLSVAGLRSSRASRTRPLDPEGRLFDYRTEFQRDRDRILHARAFRRLRLKAEGGGAGASDRRRDRLTHTLEVAQLARTMARALSLNEDLTEAIALAHDLGSTPFGRDGARALHQILTTTRPILPGGFRTRHQSLRVVELLEKRYDHAGLNLTLEVRSGIFKQDSPDEAGEKKRRRGAGRGSTGRRKTGGWSLSGIDESALDASPPSLEAQTVSIADRIASALGDLDDALRAGELDLRTVERIPVVKVLLGRLGPRYPASRPGRVFIKANLIHRGLTHLLVTSTIQHSRRGLKAWIRKNAVTTHEEFLAAQLSLPHQLVSAGVRTGRLLTGLQEQLARRLESTAASAQASSRAGEILERLFAAYTHEPRLLDDYVLIRFKEMAGGRFLRDLGPKAMETEIARRYHASGVFHRLVSDHLAGMTDAYACAEYGRLFGPIHTPGGGHTYP
jgi:dGTPase